MFTINHLVFKIVKRAHRNFPKMKESSFMITNDNKKQLILTFKKKLALDFLLID